MWKSHERIFWITRKYLIDDGREDKKRRSTNKCIIKRELLFEIYEKCLETTQLENNTDHLRKRKLTKKVSRKIVKN